MAISRFVVLWIITAMFARALDILPSDLVFLVVIAPAVIVHLVESTRNQVKRSKEIDEAVRQTEERSHPQYYPEGTEAIVVDEEFRERVDLEIGGYIELEGWNERVVETDELEEGRIKAKPSYQAIEIPD